MAGDATAAIASAPAAEPELPLPQSPTKAPTRGRILRQYQLVERIRAYDPGVDEDAINRAYVFAVQRHGSQERASGDPYFAHPIEVAGLLTELKLDQSTIIAGLLHDTVEDTDTSLDEIESLFGPDVRGIVDGVTKLSRLELNSEATKQAENLQKFVLALAKDVRVLLVKLADRLHNMRTIRFLTRPEKRQRIARETLDIYAPLARRIGMQRICAELEDLAFEQINPQAAAALKQRVAALRAEKGAAVAQVTEVIARALEAEGIPAEVFGREKRAYSIWRKLERASISFAEVSDVYGFRIMVETVDDCYRALGAAHQAWRCVPGRIKDYISTPKPNGYRSLHTTVMGPAGARVELQIRTREMNRVAELGVAAHWRYKDVSYGYHPDDDEPGADPMAGLRSLLEIQAHGGDPDEFLEHAKLEMFEDQVFCFTPRGAVIALPHGATPVDFAYAVHTTIGETCIGARVNGEERPLRTVLRNGDVVEIIRSNIAAPPPDWESVAITGRARSAIRRLVRRSERTEFVKLGKHLAGHALHRLGKEISDVSLAPAAERLGFGSLDDMYEAVGRGRLMGADIAGAAFPGFVAPPDLAATRERISDDTAKTYVKGAGLTPGVSLHFMPCCTPVPGDRIVGVLARDRGVEVHTIDCEQLASHETDESRWIDLAWTPEAREQSVGVARLTMTVENVRGALAAIAQMISDCEGDIANVKLDRRGQDFVDILIDVAVADAKHLTRIAATLRANPLVVAVQRARG